MSQLRPLRDYLAVRELSPPTVSPGGIYVGETVDDGFVKEIVRGIVLAVGPGEPVKVNGHGSMWGLQPGDVVGYSPVCSQTRTIEGETVTFIRRDAVVGIEEPMRQIA